MKQIANEHFESMAKFQRCIEKVLLSQKNYLEKKSFNNTCQVANPER